MDVLISEVQKRNLLWNKRDPKYKDRVIVDKEWSAVAEITGISKEDAKRKWRNLRDQFIKELRRIPESKSRNIQDVSKIYRGRWQYFTDLLFLRDVITPRKTEDNVSDILEAEISMGESNERVYFEEYQGTSSSNHQAQAEASPQSVEIEPICSSVTSMQSPPKRKRSYKECTDVQQALLEIESKKLSLLQSPEDENSLFLRSLLPYFKTLNPVQQLRVRSKFQEILIQELQQNESQK